MDLTRNLRLSRFTGYVVSKIACKRKAPGAYQHNQPGGGVHLACLHVSRVGSSGNLMILSRQRWMLWNMHALGTARN